VSESSVYVVRSGDQKLEGGGNPIRCERCLRLQSEIARARSADRQALERSRARLRTLARMYYGALALIVVQALVIFGLVWSAR